MVNIPFVHEHAPWSRYRFRCVTNVRLLRNVHSIRSQHWLSPLASHGAGTEGPMRVFVPLCGKTVDLTWLAVCGHHVYGVEVQPPFLANKNARPGHLVTC
eukprot:2829520-Pyramimonas_sp.AAC.1